MNMTCNKKQYYIMMTKQIKLIQGARAMFTRQFRNILLIMVAFISTSANATEIQDISFNVMPGDKVEIRVKMDSPPPKFNEITTENPARIWMDFDGVSSALKRKTHSVGIGVTRSITAIEAGGKTRLVVNLVEMAPYVTRIDGNDLVMTVGYGQEEVSTSKFNQVSSGESNSTSSNSDDIVGVDFRRGEAGEGRFIVEL